MIRRLLWQRAFKCVPLILVMGLFLLFTGIASYAIYSKGILIQDKHLWRLLPWLASGFAVLAWGVAGILKYLPPLNQYDSRLSQKAVEFLPWLRGYLRDHRASLPPQSLLEPLLAKTPEHSPAPRPFPLRHLFVHIPCLPLLDHLPGAPGIPQNDRELSPSTWLPGTALRSAFANLSLHHLGISDYDAQDERGPSLLWNHGK